MKSHALSLCSAGLACLALSLPVGAEVLLAAATPDAPRAPLVGAMIKRSDREFLEKASMFAVRESDISRIALERSTSAPLRAFAQKLVNHHASTQRELAEIASARGVELPAQDGDVLSDWMKKDVNEFDEDYLDEIIDIHQEVIDKFEDAVLSEDPAIAAYARQHLPELQAQFTQVQELNRIATK